MEDPIVIPTTRSVQKLVSEKRNCPKVVEAPGNGFSSRQRERLQSTDLKERIAVWQSRRDEQSSLLESLKELLDADLNALKAGDPPP
ncbi:uncharacterized protein [Physcomitrium patens]|uniref:uncharacterized protein isoform X2 n=1 Tax=Physcomitrium patens TaxID=3218 RepID=UPI003CCCD6F0